jgi:uncharacterized protein YxeA
MNKKILLILPLVCFLAGCDKIMDQIRPDRPEETADSQQENTETQETENDSSHVSLHPDEVTEYDRKAVTSIINRDLKDTYGKTNYVKLKEEDIVFEKKDGIITARGNCTFTENGQRQTVPFEYQFEDKNKEYVNLNAEAGEDVEPVVTPKPGSDDLSGMTPNKVYDFTCGSGIQITAGHTGDGTVLIQIMDMDGKQVEEVINQSGEFNETIDVNLDAGEYQIWITSTDGNWSIYYGSY